MIVLIIFDILFLIIFEAWRSAELIRLRTDAQYLANKKESNEYEIMREEWHDMRTQLLEAIKREARNEVHANISDTYMQQLTGQQAMSPANYLKNAANGQIQAIPISEPQSFLKMIKPLPGTESNPEPEEPEELEDEEPEEPEQPLHIPIIHNFTEKTLNALKMNEEESDPEESEELEEEELPPINGKIKEILAYELDVLGFDSENIADMLSIKSSSVRVYKHKGIQKAPPVYRTEKKWINRDSPSEIEVFYSPCRPTEEKDYKTIFREQFEDAKNKKDSAWMHRYYFDYIFSV